MLVVWAVVLIMYMISGDAQMVKDIKLFDVVNLTQAGVTETQGYHSNSKAYNFTGTAGPLIANATVSTMFATQAFVFNEFTVEAYLQTPSTDSTGGTIVFFSRGTKNGAAFNLVFRWEGSTVKVVSGFYIKNTGSSFPCEIKDMSSYRTDWLYLTVRVHILERLIRCKIQTKDGKVEDSFGGSQDGSPIDKFPLDGELRLAQQFLTGSEHLKGIQDRFVGNLQDVVIRFGQPNCTIIAPDKQVQPQPSTPSGSIPTGSTRPACPTQGTPVENNTCVDGMSNMREDGEEWTEGEFVECSCNKRRTFCVKTVKRCLHKGTVYSEGFTWDDLTNDRCDKCKCENGVSKCESTDREFKKDGCPYTCADNESGPCPHSKYTGCFCPGKKILLNGQCVDLVSCPCVDSKGKVYPAGVTREVLVPHCYKLHICTKKKLFLNLINTC